MSLTPGWSKKNWDECFPGVEVNLDIFKISKPSKALIEGKVVDLQPGFYIDNGTEFKWVPETEEGWAELMDLCKGMVP